MILGADPDQVERVEQRPRRRTSPVVDLVYYFAYHPKSQFYQHQDKAIIGRTMRLLLEEGYEQHDIEKAIDVFYTGPSARHPVPIFPFSNKGYQQQLFAGYAKEAIDPVQRFLDRGCVRGPHDKLPWDPVYDKTLQRAAIMHGVTTAADLMALMDTP